MGYEDRPWLSLYDAGMPADISVEFDDALSMFQAAVARYPDRPLIKYFDRSISAAEVDRASDALAAALVTDGFAPGDRLAVYLQNVPQFVVAMVATWKAGGIMVSINPMNKARELEYLILDSGATVLVTLESLWEEVAAPLIGGGSTPVRTVITTNELDYLDGDPPALLSASKKSRPDGTLDLFELIASHDGTRAPAPTLGPDDVAFLTYTSGTTGPPKGAMNTHRNVVFNSTAYREWMSLTPDDAVLGVAPLFHITGLIAHLTVGLLVPMPIVLGYRFDPKTVLDLIEQHRPTFTVGAITVFIALANDPSREGRDLSSLTKVYSGGDAGNR